MWGKESALLIYNQNYESFKRTSLYSFFIIVLSNHPFIPKHFLNVKKGRGIRNTDINKTWRCYVINILSHYKLLYMSKF